MSGVVEPCSFATDMQQYSFRDILRSRSSNSTTQIVICTGGETSVLRHVASPSIDDHSKNKDEFDCELG